VSEIATLWADDKKLTLEEARREVGCRIVLDSAEGRLGTEASPALMLLSKDFDEKDENYKTHSEKGFLLSPSGLENTIRNAFGGLVPDVRAYEIAEFLTKHCLVKRSEAPWWRNGTLSSQAGGRVPRVAKRPTRERATKALKAIYPNVIPSMTDEPNDILCQKVGKWLKANKLPDVKNDTILRAAGRRK